MLCVLVEKRKRRNVNIKLDTFLPPKSCDDKYGQQTGI